MEKTIQRIGIEGGITKIVVPHEGEDVVFAHPSVGPDTYLNVGKRIIEQGMNVPTGDKTASLLHSAYCVPELKDEPEFEDIREIMRNAWLWVFNRNLWTSEGVYVVQDLKAIGKSQPLNQNELEKMLEGGKNLGGVRFSKDGKIRFASKGSYQLKIHTPESLAKDGFMVASYGIKGAEKLGEVSRKFRLKPRVDFLETNEREQLLSALGERRLLVDGRLGVSGYGMGGGGDGLAFGVLK